MIIASELNKEYMNKFKFPFIIAVSGLTKEEVFSSIKVRLKNCRKRVQYIDEIHKIAEIRLKNLY